MITGAHTVIYSTDPEADRLFLREVLKLASVDAGDGWLVFGLPPSEVAVHPSDANDVHQFYLICDEIHRFVERMQAHRVVCGPVQDQGWGLLTHLELPGGGKLGVYQPRHARPEPSVPDLPITVREDFRIIAHRGASAYAPENTRPAFELARRMNVREVEVDTRLAADGVVVLCHDDSLERYGYGDLSVEDVPSAELLSMDLGSWFSPFLYADTPPMTLKTLLHDFAVDFTFHIELKGKSPDLPEQVFTLLDDHNLIQDSVVTSFSWEQLERMRQISASCRLGWLGHDFDREVLHRAAALDLFQLCPPARSVTQELADRGHKIVEEVRVWGMGGSTSEVRSLIRKVADCGCDGTTINWPDWITQQVRR